MKYILLQTAADFLDLVGGLLCHFRVFFSDGLKWLELQLAKAQLWCLKSIRDGDLPGQSW
jgi:hypothetical protein